VCSCLIDSIYAALCSASIHSVNDVSTLPTVIGLISEYPYSKYMLLSIINFKELKGMHLAKHVILFSTILEPLFSVLLLLL
jgi:hypothetical protein